MIGIELRLRVKLWMKLWHNKDKAFVDDDECQK